MTGYRTVHVSELSPGTVLATSVFDKRFAKLLDSGARVDNHMIDRLKALGITEVVVRRNNESIVTRMKQPLPAGVRVRHRESAEAPAPATHCSSCGATIAIGPPVPELKASAWLCKTCGAVYFGAYRGAACRGVSRADPEVENPFVARVEVNVDAEVPSIRPEYVQRLVRSLARDEYSGHERRRHKRHSIAVPVAVLPLALDFRIDGEPVQMTTANVSLGGAALIHTRFVDAPYLAIDFTAAGVERLQVVLKVLRVRSLGPVYEVAGQFISQLAQP